MTKIMAWHFLREDRCLQWNGESQPIEAGYIYTTDEPELELCVSGLHGSRRAIDALLHAPGPIVCRVRLWGEVIEGDNKLAARHREVLAMADAKEDLRVFARQRGLSVAHLWEMPGVVRRYLETGDETIRDAAYVAAAGEAAKTTVRLAARNTAWSAAREAPWTAAWNAAKYAAWAISRHDPRAIFKNAAWDASWKAALAAQNTELENRLNHLLDK